MEGDFGTVGATAPGSPNIFRNDDLNPCENPKFNLYIFLYCNNKGSTLRSYFDIIGLIFEYTKLNSCIGIRFRLILNKMAKAAVTFGHGGEEA
ncbi:hypothetical protein A8L34_11570 [Bacillus sp. FJAT-27264]|nr:hypothetical protein A8L34_11570 [Bacillus sp. FJAT-27264]